MDAYLGVAPLGMVLVALALVPTVLAIAEWRTRFLTTRPVLARGARTIAIGPVTDITRTMHSAPNVTSWPIKTYNNTATSDPNVSKEAQH